MAYFSEFYGIQVRDSVAKEFTDPTGKVDDMMAGLHEVRLRIAEKRFDLDSLSQQGVSPSASQRSSPEMKR
jgi:hypothetical protein